MERIRVIDERWALSKVDPNFDGGVMTSGASAQPGILRKGAASRSQHGMAARR
jgi:hypothetical protein